MKVKDLIEILKTQNPETTIMINNSVLPGSKLQEVTDVYNSSMNKNTCIENLVDFNDTTQEINLDKDELILVVI